MLGPIAIIISSGKETNLSHIVFIVFFSIAAAVPLQPAWTAPIMDFFVSLKRTGTQSAV